MTFCSRSSHYQNIQIQLLAKSIMKIFGRLIIVENGGRLSEAPDPTIFVFNHNNYWEAVLVTVYVYHASGKKLTFISDWMFGKLPVVGWFLKKIDPIYTYAKPSRFAVLSRYQQKADGEAVCEACVARLREGQSLGIFPEGTRNPDPRRLKRGRKGVGEIILRSGAPVLPVGIDFPLRRQTGRLPVFGSLILGIGRPLSFAEECAAYRLVGLDSGLSPRERRRLQAFLSARITHGVMVELARVSGKDYPFPPPSLPSKIPTAFKKLLRRDALP